ncbi:MAG TPA: 2-oxoglutarate and iron-dependent oxygenase domain-containing protein [Alphaproteobacteria bacterium]|nr:2-oxoglutarate and iron-dependent oxygenase domain-containing protein [Alphaproteobacteria bacterium]
MKDFDAIPIIDVSALAGRGEGRRRCGKAIGAACREVGFFYVANHGVEAGLVREVFALAAEFFALPLEEKMAVAMKRSPWFRGYLPLGGETTDPATGADPKEGFDISLELPPSDLETTPFAHLRGPNQWPARPVLLRPIFSAYYEALCDLGRSLSEAFALALDLPEDFFASRLSHPTAILRVLHYPPRAALPDLADFPDVGCGAHSDYGYLTILAQDSLGGLQVQNRAGKWIDAVPMPGTFVCNIGEMMARWTNDLFLATQHRVVSRHAGSRYSVPFFFHPNPEVMIDCLPGCLEAGAAQKYPPIQSGAHLESRLREGYG